MIPLANFPWETWIILTRKRLLVDSFLTRRLSKSLAICEFASVNCEPCYMWKSFFEVFFVGPFFPLTCCHVSFFTLGRLRERLQCDYCNRGHLDKVDQSVCRRIINNQWMRLSILWRTMEIEEGVTTEADNTLRDLHNSSYDTKAAFNNCFIIHSK